jgi:hypothetical protein
MRLDFPSLPRRSSALAFSTSIAASFEPSAGHANPFDVIRKLHEDLSGLNTKADLEFYLIVGFAEKTINLTGRKHFLRGHR